MGKNGGTVDVDRVLRLFSEDKAFARQLYSRFINEAIREGRDESYYKGIEQQILGDEKFIEKVAKAAWRAEKPIRKPSIEILLKEVEKLTGVKGRDNCTKPKRSSCFCSGVAHRSVARVRRKNYRPAIYFQEGYFYAVKVIKSGR